MFRTLFADIGDEQSISASLSTFSAHITNIAAMDRALQVPALVLLDEVGTGTDPAEGGALATAIIAHFKERGALVFATTHYDALKTWGTATDGVTTAAFAFDPQTFAPSYRLVYGAPGRSLAIEISQRLGLPTAVIAASRGYLSDDRKRLDAHLERVDAQARALDSERRKLERERAALASENQALRQRESAVAEREGRLAKRVNEKLDDRLRQARKDIDEVIAQLKDALRPPHRAGLGQGPPARHLDRRGRGGPSRGGGGDRPDRRRPASTGGAGALSARVAAPADRRCPGRGGRTRARGRSSSRWTARAPRSTSAASACAPRPATCA